MIATTLNLAIPQMKIVQAVLCTMAVGMITIAQAEELIDAQRPGRQVQVGRSSSAEINRPVSYAIGDKLKIMVFEQLHPEPREGEERRDIVASAVERPELSGEYIVQEDGKIYVPLTGSVAVAGTSFEELDRALSATLSGKLNGVVRVGIQVVEREPVYVLGSVARPGPYKYIPGMSVLHALALAGAMDMAPQDRWRLLDTAREKERLLKSSERLTRSLARIATLLSERDEAKAATKRLVDIVGQAAAKARLAEAETFREVERSKHNKKEAATAAAVQSYQAELTIQRNKLTQAESNIVDRNIRMDHLTKLRERGATTDVTYYAGMMELGEAKERIQDARAIVAQTEHRISDLRHEHLRNMIDAEVDREREIRELQGLIDDDELTRVAVNAALTQLPGNLAREPVGAKEVSLSILQRTPWGLKRRAAQEDSILQPGDVLQISPAESARVASQ